MVKDARVRDREVMWLCLSIMGLASLGCRLRPGDDERVAQVTSAVRSVTGATPCAARNPIDVIGPTAFDGGEVFEFDLAESAALCVVAAAQGMLSSANDLAVTFDDVELDSTSSCQSNSGSWCERRDDSMSLMVPVHATKGRHKLRVKRPAKATQTGLRVYAQGPSISSFEPPSAQPGQKITLKGEGFTNARVFVHDAEYRVLSVAPNGDSMQVIVPQKSSVGPFVVRTNLAIGRSLGVFTPLFWSCSSPHTTPEYVPPADDDVAFEALVEAAGYANANNSNWVGAAAGNICGENEKELVLMKNEHSNFTVMRGPTPNAISGSATDLDSVPAHPWKAVAIGNLDKPAPLPEPGQFNPFFDEIVALRQVSASDVSDVVLMRAAAGCQPTTVDTLTIGNSANSEWVGVAIGDFDKKPTEALGTKEIVLLKAQHTNFFLVRLAGRELEIVGQFDLDSDPALPWKAVAAGDVDADGIDELVAVRHASDGVSATILVYKWNELGFALLTSSTVGNTGDSDWASVAVGDFNGDGRAAIVVAKNSSPNFSVLHVPAGTTSLRLVARNDLDSVAGQDWRAVVATDWSSGLDGGASELIAVRAAHTVGEAQYRTDLFVYGDDFHRVSRESALEGTKAQAYPIASPIWGDPTELGPWTDERLDELVRNLRETHTNTYHWLLRDPDDYLWLVKFLIKTNDTRSACIDGRHLRVRVALLPELHFPDDAVAPELCSRPLNSPDTPWNEEDYFPGTFATAAGCRDLSGWGAAIGRLAQDFPHLVGVGFDDFRYAIDSSAAEVAIEDEQVAQLQANLRVQAPWASFVPSFYYNYGPTFVGDRLPDIGRMVDTILFYFRNEKQGTCPIEPLDCDEGPAPSIGCNAQGQNCAEEGARCDETGRHPCWDDGACLAGTCAEATVQNAPGELCDMKTLLPLSRKLELGVYFTGHSNLGNPSARYGYDLARLALTRSWLGLSGVTAYTTQGKPADSCSASNFLDNDKRFCTVQRLFAGGDPVTVSHINLTEASCASPHLAVGDPFSYVAESEGLQSTVYRTTGNRVYELSRTGNEIRSRDLSRALDPVTRAATNPTAYLFSSGFRNVVYVGDDQNVQLLRWVHDDAPSVFNLNSSAGASAASVDSRPFGFSSEEPAIQNVLYRGADGDLRRFWWAVGEVADDALSQRAGTPGIAGDPFGFVFKGAQHVVYRGIDRHLYELMWTGASGPVDVRDFTNGGAAEPLGDPTAFIASAFESQNVVYRGAGGAVHLLTSTSSDSDAHAFDLTALSGAPAAAVDPSAYFVSDDRSSHVVYADDAGQLYELRWVLPTYPGAIGVRRLIDGLRAPSAVGEAAAYAYAVDGTQHVIYRDANGHVHELLWGGRPLAVDPLLGGRPVRR